MLNKRKTETSGLDDAINTVLENMSKTSPDTPEYAKYVDRLSTLYTLKSHDAPPRVSPDTMAIVVGNLVGIALIVGHERVHVVTSKALSFVMKLR